MADLLWEYNDLKRQLEELKIEVQILHGGEREVLTVAPLKPRNGVYYIYGPGAFNPVPASGRGYYRYDESDASWNYLETDIEALQLEGLEPVPGEKDHNPVPEWQYEHSTNNGEVLTGGQVGTGHVPDASTLSPDIYFSDTAWMNQAADRGKTFWSEAKAALMVRTDGTTGVDLELGKQVAYRVLSLEAVTVPRGAVVRMTNSTNKVVSINLAKADEGQGVEVLGIATEAIERYGIGYAVAFGNVGEIDQYGSDDSESNPLKIGDTLYLSDQVAGGYTVYPPERRIKIGVVSGRSNGNWISIAVNKTDQDRYTLNGISMRLTGRASPLVPTIEKSVNLDTAIGITRISPGVYQVPLLTTMFGGRYSGSGGLETNAVKSSGNYYYLLERIVNFTCQSTDTTGTGGPIHLHAYITAVNAPKTDVGGHWFQFTVYQSVANIPAIAAVPYAGVQVANELILHDLEVGEELNMILQFIPEGLNYYV